MRKTSSRISCMEGGKKKTYHITELSFWKMKQSPKYLFIRAVVIRQRSNRFNRVSSPETQPSHISGGAIIVVHSTCPCEHFFLFDWKACLAVFASVGSRPTAAILDMLYKRRLKFDSHLVGFRMLCAHPVSRSTKPNRRNEGLEQNTIYTTVARRNLEYPQRDITAHSRSISGQAEIRVDTLSQESDM